MAPSECSSDVPTEQFSTKEDSEQSSSPASTRSSKRIKLSNVKERLSGQDGIENTKTDKAVDQNSDDELLMKKVTTDADKFSDQKETRNLLDGKIEENLIKLGLNSSDFNQHNY